MRTIHRCRNCSLAQPCSEQKHSRVRKIEIMHDSSVVVSRSIEMPNQTIAVPQKYKRAAYRTNRTVALNADPVKSSRVTGQKDSRRRTQYVPQETKNIKQKQTQKPSRTREEKRNQRSELKLNCKMREPTFISYTSYHTPNRALKHRLTQFLCFPRAPTPTCAFSNTWSAVRGPSQRAEQASQVYIYRGLADVHVA